MLIFLEFPLSCSSPVSLLVSGAPAAEEEGNHRQVPRQVEVRPEGLWPAQLPRNPNSKLRIGGIDFLVFQHLSALQFTIFSGILLLHGRFPSFNSGGSSAQNQNQNHTFEYSQYLLLNSIVNKFHNTTFEFVHLVWNTSLVVGQLSEFYPIENLHADRKRAIISYVANSKKWRRGIGTTQRLSGRL